MRSRKSQITSAARRRHPREDQPRPPEPVDRTTEELVRLARIPEENPDPVFRISAGHVLMYHNPAAKELCRVWGCRRGQTVPVAIQAIVSAALNDGVMARHEVAFGSHTYWLTVMPSVASGYVNLYARDITDHKRTEEALRQTEQTFRAIFDNTSDGIFLHDLQTRKLTMANTSCLQMLGYTEEEFLTLCVTDLHPETDLPFIDAQIQEFLKGGKPIRNDIRFKRKDGSILFVDVSPTLVRLNGAYYVLVAMKDITQRKQMEEQLRQHAEHLEELVAASTGELRESEMRYRSLYHTIADGIFVIGPEGRIEDVNDSACTQLGYTREELLGLPMTAISARADFQPGEILDRLHAAGSLSYETMHRRKDGTTIPVELSVTPVDYRGRPAILGVARDVTERERAEEALQFTQFAIDHTADAAFWMTEDARFFYVNEAACQALGYSREELLQLTVYDVDPTFTESIWREGWRRLKEQKSVMLETVHRARDGRTYPVEIRANYLEFDGHAYDCAFARDITERKRIQETLRQLSRKNEEALQVARMGHWEYDFASGRFTFNDQYYTLHGTTAQEAGGYQMTAEEFTRTYVHPDDAHLVNESIQKAVAAEDPDFHFQTEARILRADGATRWVTVWFRIERNAQGKTVKLRGVNQDITERKQAEETLREKEYLLSESQRIGRIGSWTVDLATGRGTWTPEAFQLYGVSRDTPAPSADQFLNLVHPDDRAAVREWIRAASAGGHPGLLEFRTILPDGSIRVLSGRGERIVTDDRRPGRLVGTVQDVTEQKQAEEAVRRSQALYHDLVETSQDLIWQCDREGRYTYLNSAWETTFGYALEEMLGKPFWVFQSPAYAQRDRAEFARLLQDNTVTGYETVHHGKDGREIHLVFNAKPFWDERGEIAGTRGAAYDVTERKRAEETLRESEERFRAAFEEGAVAMALTALDSTLLKVNSTFCRMLGFGESDLVGRSYLEITHPDDRAANLVGTQRLASGEVSSFRMEKRYIRRDGGIVWGDMCTASVRDGNGRPLYCVTHIQDITDRKRAEETLRRMNEQLELQVAQRTQDLRHTVRRLRELTLELSQAEDRERKRIADILHEDVQQTLAAAKFHLSLLSPEPRSGAEVQEIVEQVKHMLKDAIEKSRSLSHELSPALYQVDLLEILSWLARQMQQKHGLTVRVEAPGPIECPSEPLKAFVYKVAQELLFNVVKHAEVSEACIRVRRLGQCLYLSVADRGRGFDPHNLEGAIGFGLLGIRERVQLLGGRMRIKSAPGAGSKSSIVVPYEAAPRTGEPTPAGALTTASKVD